MYCLIEVVGKGLEPSDPCENIPENTMTSLAAKADITKHTVGEVLTFRRAPPPQSLTEAQVNASAL